METWNFYLLTITQELEQVLNTQWWVKRGWYAGMVTSPSMLSEALMLSLTRLADPIGLPVRPRPFRRNPLLHSQHISDFGQAEQPSPSGRWGLAGCPGLSCSLRHGLQGLSTAGPIHALDLGAFSAASLLSQHRAVEGTPPRETTRGGSAVLGPISKVVWLPLCCGPGTLWSVRGRQGGSPTTWHAG